jgi:hypothetical protein
MKKLHKYLVIIIVITAIAAIAWPAACPDLYHGNKRTYVFHKSSCRYFDCPNCTVVFNSREQALNSGYHPCRVCNP